MSSAKTFNLTTGDFFNAEMDNRKIHTLTSVSCF